MEKISPNVLTELQAIIERLQLPPEVIEVYRQHPLLDQLLTDAERASRPQLRLVKGGKE